MSKRHGTTGWIAGIVLLMACGALGAATGTGEWTGTIASVSDDEIVLVGVGDRFHLTGSVTESVSGRSVLARSVAPGSSVTLRVGERESDGRFRVDSALVQPKSPLTLTGRIDGLGQDRRHLTVHGVEVEVDDHTAFSGRNGSASVRSARDLGAGLTVRMALVPTLSGTLRASEVRLTNAAGEPNEDQELKGTVVSVSDTSWTVDDKAFAITDQTLFEGDPGVGDFVEVRFHLDADGNRVADRIAKEDAPGNEVEFMGIVEAIGDGSWTISGRVVTIDGSTEISGSPKVGDSVEVHAVRQADGSLLARSIKLEDAKENEVEFQGTVEAVGASSWQIGGKTVAITDSTQIIGDPKVGDSVEVKAFAAPDGTLTAVRIKKEDSGGDNNGGDNSGHDTNDDHGGNNSGSGSGSASPNGNHKSDDGSDD